jgi:LacI family transcriptional regulator
MDMLEYIVAGDDLATCYFADNDWIAIGAVKALQSKGIRVPEDVSVIGFDNIPSAAYVEPPLTTVNVPKQYMGEIATRRLIKIMRGKGNPAVKIAIDTKLVIRKSIRAVM